MVVCVSGGAIRSAYWSAKVLDRIGREVGHPAEAPAGPRHEPGPRPFDRHVRIITGASGGMVGMPYYVRWLFDGIRPPGDPTAPGAIAAVDWSDGRGDGEGERNSWVHAIPPFNLRPVARYIALREVPYMFVRGLGIREDRGVALERDWAALRLPFSALAEAEGRGRLPSLIFSPMTVEDGRRLLISNLDLRFLVEPALPPPDSPAASLALTRGSDLSSGNDGALLSDYSLSAIEFAKVFPRKIRAGERVNDLYLSTAARMSATFPYVSPAVYLPSDPPLRVVDAGYYDNYGVDVATAWLFRNRDWLIKNTSGVLMVQVRDALSVADRFHFPETPDTTYARLLRGFQFFFSPVEGVARARYASSSFRNDAQVAALSDNFTEQTRDRGFFTTAVFELSTNLTFPGAEGAGDWPGDRLDEMLADADASGMSGVAMSWYLTVAERDAIDQAIPDYAGLLAARGPAYPPPAGPDGGPTPFPGMGISARQLDEAFGVTLDSDPNLYREAFGEEMPREQLTRIGIVPIDVTKPKQRAFRVRQLQALGDTLRQKARKPSVDGSRDLERLAVVTRSLNRASSYEAIDQIRRWWSR